MLIITPPHNSLVVTGGQLSGWNWGTWPGIFQEFGVALSGHSLFNSLVPGINSSDSRSISFKFIIQNGSLDTRCEIVNGLYLTYENSTSNWLVQWGNKPPPRSSWPMSVAPYGVTRQHWVNCAGAWTGILRDNKDNAMVADDLTPDVARPVANIVSTYAGKTALCLPLERIFLCHLIVQKYQRKCMFVFLRID